MDEARTRIRGRSEEEEKERELGNDAEGHKASQRRRKEIPEEEEAAGYIIPEPERNIIVLLNGGLGLDHAHQVIPRPWITLLRRSRPLDQA